MPTNPVQTTRVTPQLRIAVTPVCNLHCFFCRPEGEGIPGNASEVMGRAEIAFLVSVAAEVGFTNVKFTGGEPLLRKDMIDVVSDTAQCAGVTDVQMVTNGTLLEQHASDLRNAGLSSLTISLDAATPETFQVVRGGDLVPVLRGLEAARAAGLEVRINAVISRRNVHEIPGLIAVARSHGTSLKLLDLVNLTAPEGNGAWLEEFVPFTEVRRLLEDIGASYEGLEPTPGGVGAPLLRFRTLDGVQVVIKDSLFGLYFSPSCQSCTKYPCQDAIISLRVTHDGCLKKCLSRDDNLVPVLGFLVSRDHESARSAFQDLFADMAASEFTEGVWQPPTAGRSGQ